MAKKKSFPLDSTIREILQGGPKTLEEIINELDAKGYKAKKDPKKQRIVKGRLTRMVKKGILKLEGDKYSLAQ